VSIPSDLAIINSARRPRVALLTISETLHLQNSINLNPCGISLKMKVSSPCLSVVLIFLLSAKVLVDRLSVFFSYVYCDPRNFNAFLFLIPILITADCSFHLFPNTAYRGRPRACSFEY
jgi:hypothetical protein